MTAHTNITNWGLVGPTTRGIKWLGTPENVAQAWHEGRYPNSVLRVARNGSVGFGSGAESKLVYNALEKLLGN